MKANDVCVVVADKKNDSHKIEIGSIVIVLDIKRYLLFPIIGIFNKFGNINWFLVSELLKIGKL